MSRLTIDKRTIIIKKETNTKYHDVITAAEKEFSDEILKEARKTVPKWITDEMIESKFINTNDDVIIKGIKDPNNLRYHNKEQSESYCISSYIPTIRHRHIEFNITKTIQNKIDKVTKLKKERDQFKKKIRGVLLAFSSIKKLLEHLPELETHFEGDIVKSKALVPIAAIKEVKKLIKRTKA